MAYKDFWWASALNRLDTRDALKDVHTRGVPTSAFPSGTLETGVPPEEVTTFNLIRRLISRGRAAGAQAMALHSRPLEGGNKKSGRPPSGIDIEIAVEINQNQWVDLALQAKKYHPGYGTYRGWKATQNTNMINWAKNNGGRTPGMLLYNTSEPPFVGPGNNTNLFGACCVRPKQCHGWKWPGSKGSEWSLPDKRSPLSLSLVIDLALMTGQSDPTPASIQNHAFPLECIFCPFQKQYLPSGRLPDWAAEVLETPLQYPNNIVAGRDISLDPQVANTEGPRGEQDSMQPRFSLVLGMGQSDEDKGSD